MDENKTAEVIEITTTKKIGHYMGTIIGAILFGCGISIVVAITIKIVQWILGF